MPYHITYQNQTYIKNEHFEGECPKCNEWEAPITSEELSASPLPKRIHTGSTQRVRDPEAAYLRHLWYELFRCPKCGTRFGVQYSDV